jgi:hypothetical protein
MKKEYKANKAVFAYDANCPSCGTNNAAIRDTRYRYCYACTCIYDKENNRVIAQPTGYVNKKHNSYLRVGLIFQYDGKDYYITGRTNHANSYREYYQEDGSSGYSGENWSGEVWHMETLSGEKLYLTEDYAYGCYVGTRTPEYEQRYNIDDFFSDNASITFNNKNFRVQEYGVSTVTFFEGESDDPLIPNRTETRFASFKIDSNTNFVIEAGESWSECYLENKITFSEIQIALLSNPEVKMHRARVESFKPVSSILFWACIFLFIAGIVFSFYPGSKHTAFLINLQNEKVDDEDGWLSRPFKIENTDKLYEVEMEVLFDAAIPQDGCFVVYEILDKDTLPINGFKNDFWVDSGSDYEGAWRETSPALSDNFKFDEAGSYFVRIYVERDSTFERIYPQYIKPLVKFTLYEGAFAARYIFIGWFLMVILWFASVLTGEMYAQKF